MSQQNLDVELVEGVLLLTLKHPATLNALSREMADELADTFRRVALGMTTARAILITGEGRAFCSGSNLAGGGGLSRASDVDGKPDSARILEQAFNPLVVLMRDSAVPTVAAVNGVAAGIGCALALMCDLIVADENAYFLQAFRRIGLVADGGASYLLPRLVGKARAMEMLLMGDKIPAPKALEWGLINRCTNAQELKPTALGLAQNLASGPASLSLIRRQVWKSLDNSWIEQLDTERRLQRDAGKTSDYREGVTAFIEKRSARFSGA